MATAPAKPLSVNISNLKATSFTATIVDGSNGGSAIDGHAIWLGTTNDYNASTTKQYIMTNPNTNVINLTGLVQGKTYYVWGQARNQIGPFWGPLSDVVTAIPSTVPPTPQPVVLSNLTDTSVFVGSMTNGDGGQPILEWQIGWDTNPPPTTPRWTTPYMGTGITVGGLTPGTKYNFWARVRNALGWSVWSPTVSATTTAPPAAPSTPVLTSITQNSAHADFTTNADNGAPILEAQVGYGKSSASPEAFVSGTSVNITNLDSGAKYYFWSRARNAAGWGPYSPVASATLLAGAWILVNNVWQRAVPYVNVGGVWKLAKPWAKIAGVWKETA